MRQWNSWILGLMVCAVVLATACAGPTEESAKTVNLSDAAELGTLAAQIDAEPDRADDILSAVSVTRVQFEEAILAVARDPEKARVYAEAFRASAPAPAAS